MHLGNAVDVFFHIKKQVELLAPVYNPLRDGRVDFYDSDTAGDDYHQNRNKRKDKPEGTGRCSISEIIFKIENRSQICRLPDF